MLTCLQNRTLCYLENRRRDSLGEEGRKDRAFQDLTDKVCDHLGGFGNP